MVRIDRVVTRGGDAGQTSLGDGRRVSKDDVRVEAYGTVDEANASIGALRLHCAAPLLARIQNDLFDIGADLCVPGEPGATLRIGPQPAAALEAEIATLNATLAPLASFILPAGARRRRRRPPGPNRHPPRRTPRGHPLPHRTRQPRGHPLSQPPVGLPVRPVPQLLQRRSSLDTHAPGLTTRDLTPGPRPRTPASRSHCARTRRTAACRSRPAPSGTPRCPAASPRPPARARHDPTHPATPPLPPRAPARAPETPAAPANRSDSPNPSGRSTIPAVPTNAPPSRIPACRVRSVHIPTPSRAHTTCSAANSACACTAERTPPSITANTSGSPFNATSSARSPQATGTNTSRCVPMNMKGVRYINRRRPGALPPRAHPHHLTVRAAGI